MLADGEFEKALAAGLRYLLVEPINEITACDFPQRCVAFIADEKPGEFQNLHKILCAADGVILCQLPLAPKGQTLVEAVGDNRRVVVITCSADSFPFWFAEVQPYRERLLAIGSTPDPRRLN